MDFFGMGFGEILLIIILALIIFGPGRLPEIARTIGRITRSLRKATTDLTTSLTKEVDTVGKDQSSPSKALSQSKADEPPAQLTDTTDESTGIEKSGPKDE
jgi:Tat protein translocase TatB subunit